VILVEHGDVLEVLPRLAAEGIVAEEQSAPAAGNGPWTRAPEP
jgi:hypothetical protein